ncbi:MAG: DegT/DnrJ/EryC1/StrS family aminotransferase [Spirochaetia bacterium]|nr:DegT/DnrJ/EryC1/StrS family aminotransferase [Spirochaetia bacterium]
MLKKIETPIPIMKPYLPPKEAFMKYADSIWETRHLTHGGPLVKKFSNLLSEYLKVAHTVVFANGHLALDCALKALGIKDGEAITTPYTYISTSNALSMNGLKPVYCDIKEEDCSIDENKIEALITEKTKVIVPVHVYGFPCKYKKIQEIADKYNLKVVYDAAHAFGVEVEGRGIGSLGNASMFSFHATKVFHTVEGGAVTTEDDSLEEKLIAAKNFGMINADDATTISFNAKMTEIHAAMGLANLEIVDWEILQRKQIIERYIENLKNINGIRLFHWDKKDVKYNYSYFPIILEEKVLDKNRDFIAEILATKYNIFTRRYFYPILSDMSCYKKTHNSNQTPIAKHISDQVLMMPLFVEMTPSQIDYVCDAIKEILNG